MTLGLRRPVYQAERLYRREGKKLREKVPETADHGSSHEFIRGTPEERAKFGSVIRKVQH